MKIGRLGPIFGSRPPPLGPAGSLPRISRALNVGNALHAFRPAPGLSRARRWSRFARGSVGGAVGLCGRGPAARRPSPRGSLRGRAVPGTRSRPSPPSPPAVSRPGARRPGRARRPQRGCAASRAAPPECRHSAGPPPRIPRAGDPDPRPRGRRVPLPPVLATKGCGVRRRPSFTECLAPPPLPARAPQPLPPSRSSPAVSLCRRAPPLRSPAGSAPGPRLFLLCPPPWVVFLGGAARAAWDPDRPVGLAAGPPLAGALGRRWGTRPRPISILSACQSPTRRRRRRGCTSVAAGRAGAGSGACPGGPPGRRQKTPRGGKKCAAWDGGGPAGLMFLTGPAVRLLAVRRVASPLVGHPGRWQFLRSCGALRRWFACRFVCKRQKVRLTARWPRSGPARTRGVAGAAPSSPVKPRCGPCRYRRPGRCFQCIFRRSRP